MHPPPKPRRPVCPALILAERVDTDVARQRIDIHNLMNGGVATSPWASRSTARVLSSASGAPVNT